MYRYKIVFAYDGTHFSGYQTQPNGLTVQDSIERALSKIAKGEFVRIHAASRTDAGVHAKGQVAHFDFPFEITPDGLYRALNTLVPDSIVIYSCQLTASDFHARYDVTGKKYEYRLYTQNQRNPFKRYFTTHHPYPMDPSLVQQALKYLVGKHDFSSFVAANTEVSDKVRTIYQAHLDIIDEEWVFTFVGDGFLYNMIRILVGTLIEIGEGKREPQEMQTIIEARDRSLAGKTFPPTGLCLVETYYDDSFKKEIIEK